ncbi:hypothetical protein KCH_28960 [Kitasatospora cheerisanensis KCTC 2395]|uniref:Uncharacterized protein n=1 Tax=Kitasatospora cheerisanensis KCTC 2395 TaxID=1348663 RepID=A0A066Z581_9ACTN|nr:hypothetical protein KCH_28960 [Kitasatospora cheerisanensis KCTC 2395]
MPGSRFRSGCGPAGGWASRGGGAVSTAFRRTAGGSPDQQEAGVGAW